MRLSSTPPANSQELTTRLLPLLRQELIAELGGAATESEVLQWASGELQVPVRGMIRLRVAFEVTQLLVEAGSEAADVEAWFTDAGSLASQGMDLSPMDLFRHESLKDAAKVTLAAARAVARTAGVEAEPLTWSVSTLILLDVDGVLLAEPGFAAPAQTAELEEFEFHHPAYTEPVLHHVSAAALEAVGRWSKMPDVLLEWLTSWGQLAPDLLAPRLGLPRFPVFTQPSERDVFLGTPWKTHSLWSFVSDCLLPGMPFRILCIDDRHMRSAGAKLKGMRQPGRLIDSRVIEPTSSRALTVEEVAVADAWLVRDQAVAKHPAMPTHRYMPTAETVAVHVREAREGLGMSQSQLADQFTLDLELIERLEAGRMRSSDLVGLLRLLKALGIEALAIPSIAPEAAKVEDIDLAQHVKKFGPQ